MELNYLPERAWYWVIKKYEILDKLLNKTAIATSTANSNIKNWNIALI